MNKLFRFQHEGVSFLTQRTRALIASDPGTGKTIQLIVAINQIAHAGERVLVLCPKSVRLNWEREIEKWKLNDQVHWSVRNWDQLVSAEKSKEILEEGFTYVVADESHMGIKNPKAKRCRFFLEQIVPKAKRVWLSTATPASKSGLDYYCTLKVLLPTIMEKVSTRAFQKHYCQEKYCAFTPGNRKYEGFKNTEELKGIFKKVSIRHRKEEVLPDLPEKIYTNLVVEVDPSVVAMNLDLCVETVTEKIAAGEPLPGHVAHVMQANAMAKLDQALEWIGNFPEDESLVVFAWHRSVVHALAEKIPGSEVITGETSEKSRQIVIDKFQEGSVKRLICNMAAGGVGVNLQKASTALYVEFPFSPAHLVQSESRIHRIGSAGQSVHLVRMIGAGTVDESIWRVLDERMRAIQRVGV